MLEPIILFAFIILYIADSYSNSLRIGMEYFSVPDINVNVPNFIEANSTLKALPDWITPVSYQSWRRELPQKYYQSYDFLWMYVR